MTDEEKLTEIVRDAAKWTLPHIIEDWQLDMFINALLADGVTVRKRRRNGKDKG